MTVIDHETGEVLPATTPAHPVLSHRSPIADARMSIDDLRGEVLAVKELVKSVLIEGSDYGTIPGTKKPTLFKSGAETLLRRFGFGHQLDSVEVERDDQGRKYGVTYRCTVFILGDTSQVVSTCDGYAGYDEPDREEHTTKYGKLIPRAPWNTMIKMSIKRALVGATLQATATSGLFTQDLDDSPPVAHGGPVDEADWFVGNGWGSGGKAAHDEFRDDTLARVRGLSDVDKETFRAWCAEQNVSFKGALTLGQAQAARARVAQMGAVPAPESADSPAEAEAVSVDSEPVSAAPAATEDDTPVDDVAFAAVVETVKAMDKPAVIAALTEVSLSTAGNLDVLRRRLAEHMLTDHAQTTIEGN